MNKLIASLFLLVILYGVFNAYFSGTKSTKDHRQKATAYRSHAKSHRAGHFEEELSRIDTPAYTKQYIVSVINHGSYDLGFVGGVMEGGYVSREDAPMIACYVVELSGKKCPEGYPENAAMFFTSVCGGCHGNDGKGLGGIYPDLTRKMLLGIEKREASLRMQISKSDSRKSQADQD